MYSIAKLLHRSIFLNGSLVIMETWSNCTEIRLHSAAHIKIPTEAIYLELGVIPFRFHLIIKRIMYYQTVTKRDDNETKKEWYYA